MPNHLDSNHLLLPGLPSALSLGRSIQAPRSSRICRRVAIASVLPIAGDVPHAPTRRRRAAHQPSRTVADPFAGVRRRSLATFRHSGVVDTRRHARREPRGRARRLTKGRDGPDADHAVDMGGSARPLRPRRQSLSIRTTISWPARRFSESCMTATDRPASWPPTMQVRVATKTIWRPADRCPAETQAYVAAIAPTDRRAGRSTTRSKVARSRVRGPKRRSLSGKTESSPNVSIDRHPIRAPRIRRTTDGAVADVTALAPRSDSLFVRQSQAGIAADDPGAHSIGVGGHCGRFERRKARVRATRPTDGEIKAALRSPSKPLIRACLSPCRSVGSRAAPAESLNDFNATSRHCPTFRPGLRG